MRVQERGSNWARLSTEAVGGESRLLVSAGLVLVVVAGVVVWVWGRMVVVVVVVLPCGGLTV